MQKHLSLIAAASGWDDKLRELVLKEAQIEATPGSPLHVPSRDNPTPSRRFSVAGEVGAIAAGFEAGLRDIVLEAAGRGVERRRGMRSYASTPLVPPPPPKTAGHYPLRKMPSVKNFASSRWDRRVVRKSGSVVGEGGLGVAGVAVAVAVEEGRGGGAGR
ncbi:hypothetical protein HDV00_009333 [Rhizophlyctis rosea]|nr:hypothetical protein HDV00_009333 [Rhizophlyctis rosea]